MEIYATMTRQNLNEKLYNNQNQLKKPSMPKTLEPSTEKKIIGTVMIDKEQASNRKNGTKFDLIKTVKSLKKAQEPGSNIHYEELLQKRQSGQFVMRRRDEGYDSPFDDEKDDADQVDIEGMSISNFSKRYESQYKEQDDKMDES